MGASAPTFNMDKQEVKHLEEFIALWEKMYFDKHMGEDWVKHFLIFQNVAKIVGKYKNPPKLEPVKKKPIKKVKEKKNAVT